MLLNCKIEVILCRIVNFGKILKCEKFEIISTYTHPIFENGESILGKPSSKWKESSKPKDFSQFRTTDGKFGSIFRKEERRYSKDNEINSFENSYDASLLSSEIDDLSLNTSLNLSDEVDPLKSF